VDRLSRHASLAGRRPLSLDDGSEVLVEPIGSGEELRYAAKRDLSIRLETDTPTDPGMNPESVGEVLTGTVKRKGGKELSVPDLQSLMLPLLKFASDGEEHSMPETRQYLAKAFSLSDDDQKEMLPSGRQTRFGNRVAWAKVYLSQAGLLESPKRGIFKISENGRKVLSSPPDKITIKYLEQFPEFREFKYERKGSRKNRPGTEVDDQAETPEEALEQAAENLRNEVAQQLIKQVKDNSPSFFEKLVVELLVKMGYGGSIKDAGQAIGQSGDEGIDGIIKEDKLGLDLIYIQAKRWEASVGRPELQKFVGALHGKRAKKGVFITTSSFSQLAIEYVNQVDPNIVLIDGERLVDLMIDYNLGVSVANTIEIKKIDSDYFVEE